ncbi:MAG: glycosyltransferase family 2 protein [Patescibacteria group bacterium]
MAKKKITISVAIATYNEAIKLGACLASIGSWVDEIVLVDGGSSDGTLEIAKKFGAVISKRDNPVMFHINKNRAIAMCKSDWILQLDADEVVGNDLSEEIRSVIKKKNTNAGYQMPRKNFFVGRWLSKGGQYPDYLVRLFQNGKGRLPCKYVHEQIKIDGEIGTLKEPLLHYTNNTLEEYWAKADTYTNLTAIELRKKYKRSTMSLLFAYCFIKPIVTFFMIYVRHKGFVDGWQGLQFALFSSLHFPMAYKKFIFGNLT